MSDGVLGATEVRRAAATCSEFLGDAVDRDWSVSIPDLEMSVAGVVAHAAEGCLWYAIDLAAGGADLESVEHRVKPEAPNADLVATLNSYAVVVAAVIETSAETARGFHPMGTADPSGFAAMACDEMLIHTDDAARGLGSTFRPPEDMAGAVLGRLFPWVPLDGDPWELLQWANGRIPLGDRDRLEAWAWYCAPLAEWDGTVPTPPRRDP